MGNKQSTSSLLSSIQKNALAGKDIEKDLSNLWSKHDKDQSGWLENAEAQKFFEEVYDWLQSTGSTPAQDKATTVSSWVVDFDQNGDGKISWKEFVEAAKSVIGGKQ